MRLYNNDPASPEPWFTEAKKRQFVLRDLYTYGCPRSGGKDSNREDWANNYLIALNNHLGKSWRIVNNLDPVTHVPPVIPILTIWNHVDNGIQVFAEAAPQALPSEVGTQPGVFIPFWHLKDHRKSNEQIRPWDQTYSSDFNFQKPSHTSLACIILLRTTTEHFVPCLKR